MTSIVVTVATVLVWYVLNITIVITNRALQTTGGLSTPVSLTLCHMIGSSIFANSAVMFCSTHFKQQSLSSYKQGLKILMLAGTFAVSIVCGVAALAYIPVSFKEMIAATTPLFTAIMAFCIAREGESYSRTLALLLVAVGAVISTEGEPLWNFTGFMLGMAATATRALKTVLQHILLSSEDEKLDSMNLLRFMSMFAMLLLIPAVAIFEGPTKFVGTVSAQIEAGNTTFVMWLVFNILSAFLVNLFQFFVTKCVGPTALQVLGNFKGVLCAVISIFVFRNPVTVQSMGGYCLTTAGVFLYSYLKQTTPKLKVEPGNSKDSDYNHKGSDNGDVAMPAHHRLPMDASKLPLIAKP